MYKFLINNMWALWVGFGLSAFFNVSVFDWQFWVFTVPLIVLVNLSST